MGNIELAIQRIKAASDLECTKWPDGDWHHCCVIHDYDYAEGVNKWKADGKLAWCVMKASYRRGTLPWLPILHIVNGLLMWLGVTLFGWKPWLSYRKERRAACHQPR